MKFSFRLILVAMAVFTGGCATVPQMPLALSPTLATPQAGRIGVGMTALPKLDTQVPGASCLLCLMAATAATSGITAHAATLPYENLPKLKNEIADLLRKKGADVIVIAENLDVGALPNASNGEPNAARKDFSALRQKYKIDKLLVVEIKLLGFTRSYSAYFPTSDPKSLLDGVGYIVNLANNTYDWYMPVSISKGTDQNWDEPPEYPGLTNAYFQTLEIGRDTFLRPFTEAPAAVQPTLIESPAKPISANGSSPFSSPK
jgi:hypothetical protein